jgi:integrase
VQYNIGLYCTQIGGLRLNKYELQVSLEKFITEMKYDEKALNTLIKYRRNIQTFIDFLNDEEDITKDHTLSFKSYLIENFETPTVNSYIFAVNKFLKSVGLSECTVKQLKQQSKSSLNEMLTASEYKRLLKFAKQCGRYDLYYIMKILALTGIRISELEYFTVENLKTNYIRVQNKGKERVITLRQDLLRELRKYCRDNNIKQGYLFKGQVKGKMPNKSTIWRNMKRIAGKARIKKSKVHAHSFRHLFAKTYLNEHHGNITDLADILGHSTLETTRIYTRTTDEEKKANLEKMKY